MEECRNCMKGGHKAKKMRIKLEFGMRRMLRNTLVLKQKPINRKSTGVSRPRQVRKSRKYLTTTKANSPVTWPNRYKNCRRKSRTKAAISAAILSPKIRPSSLRTSRTQLRISRVWRKYKYLLQSGVTDRIFPCRASTKNNWRNSLNSTSKLCQRSASMSMTRIKAKFT